MKCACQYLNNLALGSAMALLLACSGGSGGTNPPGYPPDRGSASTARPPGSAATRLAYQDPPGGDYRLVKDPASTDTHLVLNLVGPAVALSGMGFHLAADEHKVTWAMSNAQNYVGNALFDSPIVASRVDAGLLRAAIYQENPAPPKTPSPTTPLAVVALDLAPGTEAGTIAFSAPAGRALILNPPGSSSMQRPFSISVGLLAAQ